MLARILLMALLMPHLYATASDSDLPPSPDMVQTWWKLHSAEEMKIEGDLVMVRLRNKEVAFLAPVGFYSRGRNSIWHTILVRPTLKEVREVAEPMRRDMAVYDLDHDGISEVTGVSVGSGQGTTAGVRSIVQFHGWSPVVLHQVKFHDNLGACGQPPGGYGKCRSVEVKWRFEDLDRDGVDDLVEEVVTGEGLEPDKLKSKKKINGYLFKNSRFVSTDADTAAKTKTDVTATK